MNALSLWEKVGVRVSFACEDDAFLIPNLEAAIGRKLDCTHPPAELLQKPRGR